MSLEIIPLQDKHLDDAAALVAARFRALRRQVAPLPIRYQDPGEIRPLLGDLAAKAPGVAAFRGDRLVGFLLGMRPFNWRGRRSVYSPEWAHAADPADSRNLYQQMYAHLSARWVANGCFTHLVTLMADDRSAVDGWHWLGFGMCGVDAMRDLSPLPANPSPVEVRRAGPEDTEAVVALGEGLDRYMAGAPIFMAFVSRQTQRPFMDWLADPAGATWLAYQSGRPAALMGVGPAGDDRCLIVQDPGTAGVEPAFTAERARRGGLASALLERSIAWAREAGYERLAVDFEPENLLGSRFWLSNFQPVCYSLARVVDERVAWGHGRRGEQDFW